MLSIIVPVYNVEDYLEECIDSILHSTYKEFELILIDDGSTDASGRICDQYAEKSENVVVIHQQNEGQAIARNKGIEIAKGDYIGFVDSDDYIEETMYEKMIKTIEDFNADVVVCRHYDDFDGKKVPRLVDSYIKIYTGTEAAKLALEDKKINSYVWDKVFRRSLFQGIYFTPGRYFEDTMLIPQILIKAAKVACIPEPLYYYRFRLNGTMNTLNQKRFLDKIYAVEDNIQMAMQQFPDMVKILMLRNSEAIRDLADSKCFQDLSDEYRGIYIQRYRECYFQSKSLESDLCLKVKLARLLLYISPRIYNLLRRVI
ncbi:MAG: glycosyltransferase [Faecalibacterium sp.]